MLRLIWEVVFHMPSAVRLIMKMHKVNKSDKYSREDRLKCAREVVTEISQKGKITIHTEGLDNLPQENGYVMYANHQGKYDGLAISHTHPYGCSIIVNEKRAKNFMFKQFIKLTDSKTLKMDDFRSALNTFKEVEEEVKVEKKNYLIFPEGKYEDNKNEMIDFHTGCMKFVFKAKCPIVPVCLYDTYKVYGINSIKKVKCEVHYLMPIMYEEYKDLNKRELADLIKERIQERLDVIKLRDEL